FTNAKRATAGELGAATENWKRHYLEHIARYRTWYSPERAVRWTNTLPPGTAAPVFFVGFPRSGTTLFEQMLDSHPHLATTGETQILGRLRTLTPSIAGRPGEFPQMLDTL